MVAQSTWLFPGAPAVPPVPVVVFPTLTIMPWLGVGVVFWGLAFCGPGLVTTTVAFAGALSLAGGVVVWLPEHQERDRKNYHSILHKVIPFRNLYPIPCLRLLSIRLSCLLCFL